VTTLVEHLSSFLGESSAADRVLLDRVGRSIGLVRFDGHPCEGATTVVTNGLSDLPHHRLREELLLACWTPELSTDLLLVVEFVARQLAEGREPLAYGDVIGPAGPLVPGSAMEALYVCEPTYFPEGFAAFNTAPGCRVRLRWLVPIHAPEARIVEHEGAEFFEGLLVDEDPDLLSLGRPPVRLAG